MNTSIDPVVNATCPKCGAPVVLLQGREMRNRVPFFAFDKWTRNPDNDTRKAEVVFGRGNRIEYYVEHVCRGE